MKLPMLCVVAAVTIFALFCAGSASADPKGLWLAQDGAHVKMRIPRSLHRLLSCLGPYQSLLILAIPLAIVEPPKLVALFVVGEGHFVAGVLIMIFAYEGSLFVIERLFLVFKPKLLTLLAMVRDRSRQAHLLASPNVDASAGD
jgi:hypothetical protein